jgi:hypothetical protein
MTYADYSKYTQPRKSRSQWRSQPKHFGYNRAHAARYALVSFRTKTNGARKHLRVSGSADLWDILDVIRRNGGTGRNYKVVWEK